MVYATSQKLQPLCPTFYSLQIKIFFFLFLSAYILVGCTDTLLAQEAYLLPT